MSLIPRTILQVLFIFVISIAPVALLQAQSIIYVDDAAAGANNGTIWSDAYISPKDAINAATGNDVIAIAGGVYLPGATESDSLLITGGQNGLKIYGGWAGTEAFTDISDLQSQLGNRDFSSNATIISGDIDNNDTKNAAGISLTASDISGANTNHVFYLDGVNNGSITSATVLDGLTITGGQADGAANNDKYGGGLFCDGSGSGHVCSPTISNVVFAGNTASTFGGAVFNNSNGGGTTNPYFINVVFTGNSSLRGGAIMNDGRFGGNSSPVIINTTFNGNSASFGGAMFTGGGSPIFTNVILYGNSAGQGSELYNFNSSDTPTLSHTLIEGGVNGAGVSGNGANTDGGGNIDADPMFVNTAAPDGNDGVFGTSDDGLRLRLGSPALDTGDNTALPADSQDTDGDGNITEPLPSDITGADRIQESTVDMGAYEGGVLVVPGDIIYVDNDATGANDGSSWTDALTNIQQAIDSTTTYDVVAIASGIYTPGATESDSLIITGAKDGIRIYGGWAGTETFSNVSDLESQLGNRDFSVNATILSGDVDNNDAKNTAGITLTASDIVGNNSNHIFHLNGKVDGPITSATVLDGLTITGGQADGTNYLGYSGGTYGGGLYCFGNGSGSECSPILSHINFAGNTASHGGAIMVDANQSGTGSPVIINSTFTGNTAGPGAAIFFLGNNGGTISPTIINSVFTNNSGGDGGAIFNSNIDGASNPTISNTTFTNNSASSQGGAIFNSGNGSIAINNSIIYGNSANFGYEIYNTSVTPIVSHSIIRHGVNGPGVGGNNNTDGGGNLEYDPYFADADNPAGDDGVFGTADDGLQLQAISPAREAGNNSDLPTDTLDLDGDDNTTESIPYDITGANRIRNSTVDMGAYEAAVVPAKIIFVDDAAAGDNDGTSWANAYSQLQDAINDATGNDVIAVAAGIYYPTSGTDKNSSFTITGVRDGLKIYGGWAGTESFTDISDLESQLGNRDFTNATILSGDIDKNDTKNPAGITLTASDIIGSNSNHILYLDGGIGGTITTATVLDGLTITGGQANASGNVSGGGLYCNAYGSGTVCSPTISNIVFVGNLASQRGGALYNRGNDSGISSPVIINSVFTGDSSGYQGAAIYNNGTSGGISSPTITNTTIAGNIADFHAGAILNDAGSGGTSSPVLTNVILSGNIAVNNSSANEIYNNSGATPGFSHSLIEGNFISGGNNIDSGALFVDTSNPAGDDGVFGTADDGLRLQPGSSAIDGGDNNAPNLPSNDYTGGLRMLGTAPDMGAYEAPLRAAITGSEGWRILSSPVNGETYGTLLDTLWTQGFTGADYEQGAANVYIWDESTGQFEPIADADDIPAAGTGFIVYVYDDQDYDGNGDGFPKIIPTNNAANTGAFAPSLFYTDTGTPAEDGWNLAGNPYAQTIDWDAASGWTTQNLDAAFYMWNAAAGQYQSWNGTTGTLSSNGLIAPWQGFWVKANAANPELTLTVDIKSAGGALLKQKPTPQIQFELSDKLSDLRSATIVMLGENASIKKDPLDAYKLQSLNPDYLSLFTITPAGQPLDINALPVELEESLEVKLDLDGSELSGEFELSWSTEALPDGWKFMLRDNVSGEEVDLWERSAYSLNLTKAKSATTQSGGAREESLEEAQEVELVLPRHGVTSPKVMKSTGEETPRFTLTILPGNAVSNEPGDELPREFALNQNYPNPFNPSTVIRYQLPVNSEVRLEVFDMLGRLVATLVDGERKSAGTHSVIFDAGSLASGVYLYRLKAENNVFTKKLTLIK